MPDGIKCPLETEDHRISTANNSPCNVKLSPTVLNSLVKEAKEGNNPEQRRQMQGSWKFTAGMVYVAIMVPIR